MGKLDQQQNNQDSYVKKSAFVGLRAGCLTFFIAGAATLVGVLLDTRLGVYPRWTLILLLGTAPFVLGGVYWMVRRALKRPGGEGKMSESDEIERE